MGKVAFFIELIDSLCYNKLAAPASCIQMHACKCAYHVAIIATTVQLNLNLTRFACGSTQHDTFRKTHAKKPACARMIDDV